METLEAMLDTIQVEHTADMDEFDPCDPFVWAVTDENGIIALFPEEDRACRYRLDEVNRRLNP